MIDIAKALGALDDQDRNVLQEGLRQWAKEARYTEAEVGLFGSDRLGDALDALAEFVDKPSSPPDFGPGRMA